MKTRPKLSFEERRMAIIDTARRVFIEKGFHRTTTRELAKAAGVSEALLFKHFPDKEAIYTAIQVSFFKNEGARLHQLLESAAPSTSMLVFLVQEFVSHILGGEPDESKRSFLRLLLRSLMDEGGFARLGFQEGPGSWAKKIEECVEAARASGDMVDEPVLAGLGGWCVHQVVTGFMITFLPAKPAVDYGVSREELVNQIVLFCLRGIGLKDDAIRHCSPFQDTAASKTTNTR